MRLVKDINQDLYKALARSMALGRRVYSTEKAIAKEAAITVEMAAEIRKLTAALQEANAKVASSTEKVAATEAERDAAIADLQTAKEEKERLNHQANKLLTDLSVQQAKKEELERAAASFPEELIKAGQQAVETFKGGDEFQELLEPTFTQGFKLAVSRAAQRYPSLKFEDLDPLVDEVPIPLTDALLKTWEASTGAGGEVAEQGADTQTEIGQEMGTPVEAEQGVDTQMIDVNAQAPQESEDHPPIVIV